MKRFLDYNSKLKDRAKDLRKNMTDFEKKIWYGFFKSFQSQFGIRVLRQRIIDNFIVDFYIPKLKLVIEIDGESHFIENGKIYYEERSEILIGLGLEVIRYTNKNIKEDFDGVCEDLLIKLKDRMLV